MKARGRAHLPHVGHSAASNSDREPAGVSGSAGSQAVKTLHAPHPASARACGCLACPPAAWAEKDRARADPRDARLPGRGVIMGPGPWSHEVSPAQAQLEAQRATQDFQRATEVLRAAKETISLAEQRLLEDDKRQFDSAWQEMLNHATQRV